MKTTTILAAFALAITLSACSEDPFLTLEPPASLQLKEQLQSDDVGCLDCRPVPENPEPEILEKEQLQEQDQEPDGCTNCRPLPPGNQPPPILGKEQLQGEESDFLLDCDC
ncbi:MAG: hypothetical protein H6560_25595 [Lewinellaceae bacterium]|nr:hypothetical protein [Lewinellaceae bacterium]